jgi:hypothetical protein
LGKVQRILSHDIPFSGRDLNVGSHEYKAEILTGLPRYSVNAKVQSWVAHFDDETTGLD